MKRLSFLVSAILLTACIAVPTPEPTATTTPPFVITAEDNPYAPKPNDTSLRVASIVLSSINLVQRADLNPSRVDLNLLGSVPSVCNQLRVQVAPPNNQYEIFVEVYSLVNPSITCDNVFQEFNAEVLLGVYSPGTYTVFVNKGRIGDFFME